MNLQDFLNEALEPDPDLRKGQKIVALLHNARPDLYDRLLNDRDAVDCYYDDDKIWAMAEWLRKNW
jgi:hypothetical protein